MFDAVCMPQAMLCVCPQHDFALGHSSECGYSSSARAIHAVLRTGQRCVLFGI